jgi:uracil-DNA glycosylase
MQYKIEKNIKHEWKLLLQKNTKLNNLNAINNFLITSSKLEKKIFPKMDDIFRSLSFFPPKDINVVIVGQDPYHSYGQANGLAFSVNEGTKLPPSLKNIYKELESDLGIIESKNGNLESWAKQGVLLLNTILTVEESRPGSHQGIGWEEITDCFLNNIGNNGAVVFILWGAKAQDKENVIVKKNNLIIKSPHPSPLSAYRGFFNSKPFSRTNKFLESQGKKAINWNIPS